MGPRATLRTIMGGALVLLITLGACERSGESPPAASRAAGRSTPPNLVLITVDTLRADHLSSYGYRLPTSPTLDRLAAAGVRFADTTVPWPKTWPSMASMLTGKYPATTGVVFYPERPLPGDHQTLAETLRDAGYATGAVVANWNVSSAMGFQQGFDEFVESWLDGFEKETGSTDFQNEAGLVKRYTNAEIVTDQGLEVLDRLAARRPFYLWLHYIDPHGPYVPPASYRNLFAGEYPRHRVPFEQLPPYQQQRARGLPIRNLAYYVAQYDREIRYFDDQLARLLGELKRRGLEGNTLIVLTADHGESLDEDGYFLEHGMLPYQPTARVPLLFALPGVLPAGRVVEAPVGLIDVAPTILDLLGVAAPAGLQGRTLRPILTGESGTAPQYVFMESGEREPTQLSVRKGRWKLVQMRSELDREEFGRQPVELYDLSVDGREENDVSAEHPEVTQELVAALREWQATTPRCEAASEGDDAIDQTRLDDRTRGLLKALGYVDD